MREQPDSPLSVLLVEDDRAHAEFFQRAMQLGSSVSVTHLSDGEAALDLLCCRPPYQDREPDLRLVLLDLRLPKVDGLEVLRGIKASPGLSGPPVVVLTTSEADRDVSAAYDACANAYLVKPAEFSQLSELMRDISRFCLCWNALPVSTRFPATSCQAKPDAG